MRLKSIPDTASVYLILLAVVAVCAGLTMSRGHNLFSSGNIDVILTSITVLGLVCIGQTHAILIGSLDLSVGYVMSLASVLAAGLMAGNNSAVPSALAISIGVCALVGLANGLLVGVLGLNGFITTLSTGLIISGYLTTNYPGNVGGVPSVMKDLGSASVGPIPVTTLFMLAALVAASLWLSRTRLGFHVYAVGGNAEVAKMSGIKNVVPIVFAHVISSVFAALAGLVVVARLGVGSPVVGTQGAYDLLSIAAVVLGGCALAGGRGSLWGTLGGILIFAVLDSTLSILQVNPFLKDVVRGAVLVAAVAVFSLRGDGSKFRRFTAAGDPVAAPSTPAPDRPDQPDQPDQIVRAAQ